VHRVDIESTFSSRAIVRNGCAAMMTPGSPWCHALASCPRMSVADDVAGCLAEHPTRLDSVPSVGCAIEQPTGDVKVTVSGPP
jgi:hypothetical protein